MATKVPGIPAPKHDLTKAVEALKELAEVREGLRGDPLDAFVTYRNLRDVIVTDETIVTYLGLFHVHDHGALNGLTDDDHIKYLLVAGTRALSANWDAGSFNIRALTFESDVATGTSPFTVASTTVVANLNVDAVDDLHAQTLTATTPITLSGVTSILAAAGITIAHSASAGYIHLPSGGVANQILKNSGASGTGAWGVVTENAGALGAVTTIAMSGQLTNTLAIGTAPFVITSTTVCSNLNADLLDGQHSSAFEPALGNPAVDGYVLSSTAAGVRSWVEMTGGVTNPLNIGTDDTTVGIINVYGGGAGADGGVLNLYLGADDDASIANYAVQVVEDDLLIGPNTDPDALKMVATKDLYLTDGDIYVQLAGTTKVLIDATNGGIKLGIDDVSGGFVQIYGNGPGDHTGGAFNLYLAADYDAAFQLWQIKAYDDAIYIGQGGLDDDVVKIDANKDLYVTDGDLFAQYQGTTIFATYGGATSGGISVGAADSRYGYIAVAGAGAGSDYGGYIYFDLAADYDTTISNYQIRVTEDFLTIGPSTDADALKLDKDKNFILTDGDFYIQVGGTTVFKVIGTSSYGAVYAGEDGGRYGYYAAYGDGAGSAQGGVFDLWTANDHDTNIEYYRLTAYEDDLYIGTDADPDALKLDAARDFHVTAGNILLQLTTHAAAIGMIYKNGVRFLHNFNYGDNGTVTTQGANLFCGLYSGNTTMGSGATHVSHGSFNVGCGQSTLASVTTGYALTACGYAALTSNTSGELHTAVGFAAMYGVTGGTYTVAVGLDAGRFLADGSTVVTAPVQCVYVGSTARASAVNRTNEIALGNGAVGQGTNTIMLGNSSISALYCYDTTIASPSDERIKTNVAGMDDDKLLAFVNDLRPVTFNKKHPSEWPGEIKESRWKDKMVDRFGTGKLELDPAETKQAVNTDTYLYGGMIAQEVQVAIKKHGIDYRLLNVGNDGLLSLRYGDFIPALIGAIKALTERVNELESQLGSKDKESSKTA